MTDQPSTHLTPLDDQMLSAILDEDERALRVLSLAARYHQARMAHPAGKAPAAEPLIPEDMWEKATYVPLVAAPIPDRSGIGVAIAACIAICLIGTGLLVGVTAHFWVAWPLVIVGCAIAGRLAISVEHRQEKKS